MGTYSREIMRKVFSQNDKAPLSAVPEPPKHQTRPDVADYTRGPNLRFTQIIQEGADEQERGKAQDNIASPS